MTFWQSVRAGIAGIAPVLIGVIPFGLVAGVATREVMSVPLATLFSLSVFAGAAQLAAVSLLAAGAPLVMVVVAAITVNLRFLLYSFSIAGHFRSLGGGLRAALAYCLTDQAYALCIVRFHEIPEQRRYGYYIGASAALWLTWQVTHLIGLVVGTQVPPEWGLELAVPLMFLAVMVPAVDSRPRLAAAVAAGTVAVAFNFLPYKLGLLAGTAAGLMAGLCSSREPGQLERRPA